jgi:fucose permease
VKRHSYFVFCIFFTWSLRDALRDLILDRVVDALRNSFIQLNVFMYLILVSYSIESLVIRLIL